MTDDRRSTLAAVIHHTVVDAVAIAAIAAMICWGRLEPESGLPWLALILAARATAAAKNGGKGPPSNGALPSLFPRR